MAQMKEQNKIPEKELNEMETANLSDAEFKTLIIRMLKEIIEYGNSIKKIQEEMKVILSEKKKNLQGTNREAKKAEIQINNLEHKDEKRIQPEQQEEKWIQKNEDSIRSLWVISKCTNIWITRVPEREKEEQEIENLFEKVIKKNFPNLAKELDVQDQEAQRVSNKLDSERTTPRHIIIKMPKVKDKDNLKSCKRKAVS